MAAGVLPLGLDPLIAEAKERARRRRSLLLAAGVVAIAAAALGTAYGFRSSGNTRGVCASVPPGWKQKTVTDIPNQPPTVVLTNFRFGRMNDLYGLTDRFNWPTTGVTVAVVNYGRRNEPGLKPAPLRLSRADFEGIEGSTQPSGFTAARTEGAVLYAYVEVGNLTPTTIALANQALSGVRVCSA